MDNMKTLTDPEAGVMQVCWQIPVCQCTPKGQSLSSLTYKQLAEHCLNKDSLSSIHFSCPPEAQFEDFLHLFFLSLLFSSLLFLPIFHRILQNESAAANMIL